MQGQWEEKGKVIYFIIAFGRWALSVSKLVNNSLTSFRLGCNLLSLLGSEIALGALLRTHVV